VRFVACASLARLGHGQPGDRQRGRERDIRRGDFGAGNGPVYRSGGDGVLRAAAPQRQPARVDRAALGDERAGCSYGRVHLGVGFLMTWSGPAYSLAMIFLRSVRSWGVMP